jgi:hypothetical protein
MFQNERLLLHWAAVGGHLPIVTFLLENGSPIDPRDDVGFQFENMAVNLFLNFTVWRYTTDPGRICRKSRSCQVTSATESGNQR